MQLEGSGRNNLFQTYFYICIALIPFKKESLFSILSYEMGNPAQLGC